MTARVVLSCDGVWNGFDCRQATPVGAVLTGIEARRIARRMFGWTHRWDGELVRDYCAACTTRQAKR